MDNLFEILIYGLIIISFISSFFRKKKPLEKDSAAGLTAAGSGIDDSSKLEPQFSSEPKAKEYDILKEIESFFNVEERPEKPEAEIEPVEKKESLIKDTNYKRVPEESFHKVTESEHSFVNPWETKIKEAERKKKLITPKIEKQASAYEQSLLRKEKAAKEIVGNIRNRLNDPLSLREYIVISEIIGKPKALKR